MTPHRSDTVRWCDNHCHLPPGDDGEAELAAAAEAGVVRVIDVGTDTERSHQTVANAAQFPGTVFATVGIHPHDATEGVDGIVDLFEAPGVVAVGEAGLDYHYDHSPRDIQRQVFAQHVDLAHQHDLPLVIHTREAWDDTFEILDANGTPDRTVFHCFTGGPQEAEKALERGGVLSFSGIVTFKNAEDVREALTLAGPDRAMVETDSPYLTPEPNRGKRNSPAFLPYVGRRMAEVLGMDVERLAEQLWATTHRFYALPALDGH